MCHSANVEALKWQKARSGRRPAGNFFRAVDTDTFDLIFLGAGIFASLSLIITRIYELITSQPATAVVHLFCLLFHSGKGRAV